MCCLGRCLAIIFGDLVWFVITVGKEERVIGCLLITKTCLA